LKLKKQRIEELKTNYSKEISEKEKAFENERNQYMNELAEKDSILKQKEAEALKKRARV